MKSQKKPGKIKKFLWTNKRQRARNIMCILMVFTLAFSFVLSAVGEKLSLISFDKSKFQSEENNKKVNESYEDDQFELINTIKSANGYNDFLSKWSADDTLRKSKDVINILLIGLDSDTALLNGGRSDSIILASLNKKTKKIYLTSFFRDTWTKMNIGGVERFNKTNASYFYGGDDALIDALERDYKIDIDYYVAVDFSSFTDIINAMGGITLEVEKYEAEYINRTSVHTIDYGPAVKLDGWEALVYARIRHSDSDSDVSRTKRQRKVISAFINTAKTASLSQLNDALNTLFKYVKTDLTQMQILSYASQALSNGWLNFDIEQVNLSDPEYFKTGWVGNQSVVFVDFPKAADVLQKAIYGDSNIKLSEDRVKPFGLLHTRSDGALVIN